MSATPNPCLDCSIGQNCCTNLSGLAMTREEYEENFAQFADQLIVKEEHSVYYIATKEGPCPHWKGQCTIHATRPMDCRLFPHQMGKVKVAPKHVKINYHSHTRCPKKKELRMPDADARNMIHTWAQDLYGEDHNIELKQQSFLMSVWILAKKFFTSEETLPARMKHIWVRIRR